MHHRIDVIADPGLLADLPGWSTDGEGRILERAYRLDRYLDGIAFAARIGEMAEAEDHHPELIIGWCRLTVRWTTHDAGGLTARDLACARLTDRILADRILADRINA